MQESFWTWTKRADNRFMPRLICVSNLDPESLWKATTVSSQSGTTSDRVPETHQGHLRLKKNNRLLHCQDTKKNISSHNKEKTGQKKLDLEHRDWGHGSVLVRNVHLAGRRRPGNLYHNAFASPTSRAHHTYRKQLVITIKAWSHV